MKKFLGFQQCYKLVKYLSYNLQKIFCCIFNSYCLDSSVWWSARLVISWSRVQFPFGAFKVLNFYLFRILTFLFINTKLYFYFNYLLLDNFYIVVVINQYNNMMYSYIIFLRFVGTVGQLGRSFGLWEPETPVQIRAVPFTSRLSSIWQSVGLQIQMLLVQVRQAGFYNFVFENFF